jgi:hypothetical protein
MLLKTRNYTSVLGFSWDFPEFYQGTVVGIINQKPICRVHQRSQRTTLVPDQDDVVPTACAWYTDMQCPLDQEAKFSYTAKWSSGDTDMQSSLDQEAKSSKTAKWSSGTL